MEEKKNEVMPTIERMEEAFKSNAVYVHYMDSREVAEMVGKDHSKLLKDIRRYIGQLGEAKIGPSDFWTESTYVNAQNKNMPCYLITKKGCEFIAHKLTGQKGTEFTAKYINRFHEMEDALTGKGGEYPSTHDIVEALAMQTNIISGIVGRMEKLEQARGYDRLLPEEDKDGSVCAEIAKRAEYLGELVGEVSMLNGYPKNIIFRAMYGKLEQEFGISLDVYLYVARKEYRPDACTLHAVAMWERLYERAVRINQEEIAKHKVYS